MLFDTALLESGFKLDDPISFRERTYMIISSALLIDDHNKIKKELPNLEKDIVEESTANQMEEVDWLICIMNFLTFLLNMIGLG